ncbi:hypothetical protein LTR36_002506 [Oleoguttula mirabilis]|uniref:Uncharacterized protein n=1 Tax=Oleoguttula mirabilis TaxID=1507867 RepID=A0AAV9JKD7_9PEZI|nr:hypothetical protein LTR36_002506 [Oleoguttula mirabilis]
MEVLLADAEGKAALADGTKTEVYVADTIVDEDDIQDVEVLFVSIVAEPVLLPETVLFDVDESVPFVTGAPPTQ